MTVQAVVFDWGGTLTPWHDVDLLDLWRMVARAIAPERSEELAVALLAAEDASWAETRASCRSTTTAEILARACAATGVDVAAELHERHVEAHVEAFTPYTHARPEAPGVLAALRERGLRIGLLSNTHWPREWHERFLDRDGLADLIDVRVYTSEIAHTKPHPEAFRAVLGRLGVGPARAVFVGDRPHDDIRGAQGVGMRGVLVPNGRVEEPGVVPDAVVGSLDELVEVVDGWRAA